MRKSPLDRLAEAYGLQLGYRSVAGDVCIASDKTKRALLRSMSVEAADDAAVARSLAAAPAPASKKRDASPIASRCFIPAWLTHGRAWGVTCQLYGLRSARNHGIGDFEDLAILAEHVAASGGDFIGVNPLHALFTADPERCSPFSPSNRCFLNPLYIAVDRLQGADGLLPPETLDRRQLGDDAQVDYSAVARFKLGALRSVWRQCGADPLRWTLASRAAFEKFVEEGGEALHSHCLFEAISHAMVAAGASPGWTDWPVAYRHPGAPEVANFAKRRAEDVRFHQWLQWIADAQLKAAAERARAAGMRIGLYLDFAVGTAPDGSATWSDRELVVSEASIGAPPDEIFWRGQDWGLAPMSPAALRARDLRPYRDVLRIASRHAGAIRIDHAMSVQRLFWIPHGMAPTEGCFVRYPMADMLRVLAEVSAARRAIVIGEDLGTVPAGFRDTLGAISILSYRLLYFERSRGGFRAAGSYIRDALVAASTHDLPPLASWWSGHDIALFRSLGILDDATAELRRAQRIADRRRLVARLRKDVPDWAAVASGDPENTLTPELAAAIHAFLAATPSRLLALQYEDLCGSDVPVNVAGTWQEYPNWRVRAPVAVEHAVKAPLWTAVIEAVSSVRPRNPQ
jgi:4-alpha-glucanotransferase